MLSWGIGISLYLLMLVTYIIDGAVTQQTNIIPTDSDFEVLIEQEPVSLSELSPAKIEFDLPIPSTGFFSTIADMITWRRSFFTQDWEMFRWFFTAITFVWTLAALRDFVGPIATVVQVMVEIGASVIGGVFGGVRALLRVR